MSSSSSSASASSPESTLTSDTFCDRACKVCRKPASKRCSKCQAVWYCSLGCQTKDWPVSHKNKCKTLAVITTTKQADMAKSHRLTLDTTTYMLYNNEHGLILKNLMGEFIRSGNYQTFRNWMSVLHNAPNPVIACLIYAHPDDRKPSIEPADATDLMQHGCRIAMTYLANEKPSNPFRKLAVANAVLCICEKERGRKALQQLDPCWYTWTREYRDLVGQRMAAEPEACREAGLAVYAPTPEQTRGTPSSNSMCHILANDQVIGVAQTIPASSSTAIPPSDDWKIESDKIYASVRFRKEKS